MIIDNFDLMQSILKPESTDDFWFEQIIARRKDVKDLPRADKWIKSYYIKDFDHLKSKESEIKKLCNVFKARFYLNPNVRSFERVNLNLIKSLVENIQYKQFDSLASKIDSVCGYTTTPGRKKVWVIDVDESDFTKNSLVECINQCDPVGEKHLVTIHTVNGYHLLCSPFNKAKFSAIKSSYNVDLVEDAIKSNSPTLIYFNND